MISRAGRLLPWAFSLVAFGAAASPVDVPVQRLIQSHFSPNLVLPATALWRFDSVKPYGGGGDLVCGHVNFQNSMRRYLGFLGFYAVVRSNKVALGGIEADDPMQDPTGAFKFAYHNLCDEKK
jgi:hypothetical protein